MMIEYKARHGLSVLHVLFCLYISGVCTQLHVPKVLGHINSSPYCPKRRTSPLSTIDVSALDEQ